MESGAFREHINFKSQLANLPAEKSVSPVKYPENVSDLEHKSGFMPVLIMSDSACLCPW
jgi:hypothetical protein